MRLRSRVKFVDERVKRAYYSLEKGDAAERELFKWLTRAFSDGRKRLLWDPDSEETDSEIVPKKVRGG